MFNEVDAMLQVPKSDFNETEVFWTWHDTKLGMIVTKVKPLGVVELEHAEENSAIVRQLAEGKDKMPLLVDMSEIKSISAEARQFFAIRNRESAVLSMALIVKSPVSAIIGNFFMGVSKPSIPARIFSDSKKAVSWSKKRKNES